MSEKAIDDLRQKVFYIDRSVNPYFNIQIMKLYKANSELSLKVAELEKKISEITGEKIVEPEKSIPKKTSNKKTNIPNDIRTINLE